MAVRNYITHPADGALEVAHVSDGAIHIKPLGPLDVTVTNPAAAEQGAPFAVRNSSFVTVNNATAPILSVQHAGVGALAMLLKKWEVYNDGRDVAFMDLIVGGTLTGALWTPVDAGSDFEVDSAATAITGGVVIASLLVGRDTSRDIVGDILSALELNLATPGPLSVVATDEPGQRSVQVSATLDWLEL